MYVISISSHRGCELTNPSVLQCVAVCCSVLQCVAVCCSNVSSRPLCNLNQFTSSMQHTESLVSQTLGHRETDIGIKRDGYWDLHGFFYYNHWDEERRILGHTEFLLQQTLGNKKEMDIEI